MKTEKSRFGYLLVDHRASPGLSREDAMEAGYDPDQCGEGKTLEASTVSCSHCGGSYVKNPWRERDRGHCFKCHWYLCDGCAAVYRLTGQCTPIRALADFVCGGDKRSGLWVRHDHQHQPQMNGAPPPILIGASR